MHIFLFELVVKHRRQIVMLVLSPSHIIFSKVSLSANYLYGIGQQIYLYFPIQIRINVETWRMVYLQKMWV